MNSSASAIVIIDAGVGNLGNVLRAVEHVALGCRAVITDDPDKVRRARILILPGVGAFRPPRERLRGGLETALAEALAQGAFLLGICVGFQLLFEGSDEFGDTDGLAYVPGRVTRMPDHSADGAASPHIGWNRLVDCTDHPLLKGVHDDYAYFVHSYAAINVPSELEVASCYHGTRFPAVVAHGKVMGTQFHPEKSGAVGLKILGNFLELAGGTHV